MKKFLIIAAAIFFLQPAGISAAQNLTVNLSAEEEAANEYVERVEKFISALPQPKGKYKVKQRPILIQGAMDAEIETLLHALKNPAVYKFFNYVYIAGTYKNYPVVISRTEQGMENAAATTALALINFNPLVVINQGTAGGHDKNLNVGDLVIGARSVNISAVRTAYQPAGAGVKFEEQEMRGTYSYDKISGVFQPYAGFFADETLLLTAEKVAAAHTNFHAVTGIIGSSDAWFAGIDHINLLREKYGTTCAEMETAAAAQICRNADIPFIGVRVISDNITNGGKFDANSAKIPQEFVLLMVEDYIGSVLKK